MKQYSGGGEEDNRSLNLPYHQYADMFDINDDGKFSLAESIYAAVFLETGSSHIANGYYQEANEVTGLDPDYIAVDTLENVTTCHNRTSEEFGPNQDLSYLEFVDWSLNNPFSYVGYLMSQDFLDPVCE